MEIQKGNAICISGNHMNADTAMGWYLGMDALPPEQIAAKFMSGIDTEISKQAQKGDILVCGRNFGYGKVHQSLYTAMTAIGIRCIVAESFSTQLVQSAFNGSTLLVEVPDILQHVNMGDALEVDIITATVKNLTQNTILTGKTMPPYIIEVMMAGGYMRHMMGKIMAKRQQQ